MKHIARDENSGREFSVMREVGEENQGWDV